MDVHFESLQSRIAEVKAENEAELRAALEAARAAVETAQPSGPTTDTAPGVEFLSKNHPTVVVSCAAEPRNGLSLEEAVAWCRSLPDCTGMWYYENGRCCPKVSWDEGTFTKVIPGGAFYRVGPVGPQAAASDMLGSMLGEALVPPPVVEPARTVAAQDPAAKRPHHPCYHSVQDIKDLSFCKQFGSRVRPGHEHEGWAKWVIELVEGDGWQAVVLLLIVVDACAVVLELLIETKTLVCADENTRATTMFTLHALPIGILVVFAVELAMLGIAMGRDFFHHRWHTLDLVLVYGALALELIFKPRGLAALVVLTRAWRVVRVVHGFIELEAHQHEKVTELNKVREQHRHMSARLSVQDPEWLKKHYPKAHLEVHNVTREEPALLPKTSYQHPGAFAEGGAYHMALPIVGV
eukprot:COSAG03_NODE_994_length_5077_cov_314.189835_3_plen_409_part_00